MVSLPAVVHAGRSGLVDPVPGVRGLFAEEPSWTRLIRHARCADSGLDPDQWFPVSPDAAHARQEAAAALAICRSCPVRASCLAVSLRHWDLGQHGIWGGLVAAERVQLRRRIAAGDHGCGRTLVQVMAPHRRGDDEPGTGGPPS